MPMAEGMTPKHKKKIARKACLTAMWIMIVFSVFGTLIFRLFGITIYAFQIAGGIILFGVAMDIRKGTRNESCKSQARGEDFSIVPLAIPLISGPGAITTCLMLAGQADNILYLGILIACIMLTILIVYIALIHSHRLNTLLGVGGVNILTRLMGLILAVIAIQFVINGVKAALPVLKAALG
jgi:multiple antibiotic resistance protein